MAIKTQSDKSKLKRARSWEKNRLAKIDRIAAQSAREQTNRELGTTGKQRANTVVKLDKFLAKKETSDES